LESRPSEVSDVSETLVRARSTSGHGGAAYVRPQVKQGGARSRNRGSGGARGSARCGSCLAGAVKHRSRCGGGKAEDDGRRHKRLSPAQVEDIVQEYLEHFDKSSEENGKDKTRRARSSRSRGNAKPASAPTSTVSQGGMSWAGTSGSRRSRKASSSGELRKEKKDDHAVPFIPSLRRSNDQSDGKRPSLPCGALPPVLEQGASPESPDNKTTQGDVDNTGLANDHEQSESSRQVQATVEHGSVRADLGRGGMSTEFHSRSSLGSGRLGSKIEAPLTSKKERETESLRERSIAGKKVNGGAGTEVMTEAAVEGYEACAITITGEALTHALSTAENRRYFFGLANLCSTVIACRVSPKQKSEVVTQCKRYQSGTVSLGIGDGANDVGMLVAANVGVGIQGKEGLQAVRAADFAIGEFKFVRNLMFCHGREALRRNAFQMYQTIFKNVVFGLADFFFAFLSVFAATDLFNPWLKQLYNVLYTCIPVVLFTVFDRQLPYDVLFQTPVLYPAFSIACRSPSSACPVYTELGVNMFAGSRTFWKWFIFGFYTSAALVYFPIYGMGWAFTYTNAEGVITFPLAYEGSVVFWSIIVACNLVMVPFMHTWFWFIWLGIFVNFAFWILSLVICPRLPADFCKELCGALEATHQDTRYYFSFLLAVFIALLPQYLIWFIKVTFRPSAPCVIRERIAKGVFDVVIAPRGGQKMVVVVPKKVSNEWRGFAFAEQDRTRWGQHRRSMRAFLDDQSSSFLALAGSPGVPVDPAIGPPPTSLRFNAVDGSCSSESTDTRLSRSFSKGNSRRLSKEEVGS
ncbi:phospholipid-translocating p-type flippase subfamily protein, partial [Cystoisospora suis]